MADALALVGNDVGVPIIAVTDHTEPAAATSCAAFGPVWSPPPQGPAAVETWRAALQLITTPGFAEIKRARGTRVELAFDTRVPASSLRDTNTHTTNDAGEREPHDQRRG